MKENNLSIVAVRFDPKELLIFGCICFIFALDLAGVFPARLIYNKQMVQALLIIFIVVMFMMVVPFVLRRKLLYEFKEEHIEISTISRYSFKRKKRKVIDKLKWSCVKKTSRGSLVSGAEFFVIEYWDNNVKTIKVNSLDKFYKNDDRLDYFYFIDELSKFIESRDLSSDHNTEFREPETEETITENISIGNNYTVVNSETKNESTKEKKVQIDKSDSVKTIPLDKKLDERKPLYGFILIIVGLFGVFIQFKSDKIYIYQIFLIIICFIYALNCFSKKDSKG
ncbi:MAG: hypothetical protein GY714_07030 [Desulfobacterales bacterium]|nr:hypothetical protein [Desulfobacterales bacterium]